MYLVINRFRDLIIVRVIFCINYVLYLNIVHIFNIILFHYVLQLIGFLIVSCYLCLVIKCFRDLIVMFNCVFTAKCRFMFNYFFIHFYFYCLIIFNLVLYIYRAVFFLCIFSFFFVGTKGPSFRPISQA